MVKHCFDQTFYRKNSNVKFVHFQIHVVFFNEIFFPVHDLRKTIIVNNFLILMHSRKRFFVTIQLKKMFFFL